MKFLLVFVLVILMVLSCVDSKQDCLAKMVEHWNGKEVLFPEKMVFTSLGVDTVEYDFFHSRYHIVSYVDSLGCISCKLQLSKWKSLIAEFDSISEHSVSVSFFIHPESLRDVKLILKREKFNHPVCLDIYNSFCNLNKLPLEFMFHTFLLDENNTIIAIGNPIHNPKIKELYLNIISGETSFAKKKEVQTKVRISEKIIELGSFDWSNEQTKELQIRNIGSVPLVISNITTSCGCTIVEYSKKPVRLNESLTLKVKFKAEYPEYFDKTFTVYCNAKGAPFQLKIRGNAK